MNLPPISPCKLLVLRKRPNLKDAQLKFADPAREFQQKIVLRVAEIAENPLELITIFIECLCRSAAHVELQIFFFVLAAEDAF